LCVNVGGPISNTFGEGILLCLNMFEKGSGGPVC
jgi:hypothetical protein